MTEQTDRWTKQPVTSGLRFGRFEVLRSLRHYVRAQSQGHHTIERLEERGVESASARRSSLKDERWPSSVHEHGNCFKGDVEDTPDKRNGTHNYVTL